ncbi:MAG TPA: GntR family transcriptional regulator [Verrucomicrobiae bacterium]|nr:GntR family transcriptional regulator [Verrucomicrobiae bacterium]
MAKAKKAVAAHTPPQIAEAIQRDIHTGVYEPGRHLGTIELAERFQVSRGPVREALRLLEALHLVRVLPQQGAFVMRPDDEAVQELLAIRGVVFALICETAAKAATKEDIARLQKHQKSVEALAADPQCSPRRFQRAQYEMAELIAAIANRKRMTQIQRETTFGAGIAYGHLAAATQEMRQLEARNFANLLRRLKAADPESTFAAARALHDEGVARALAIAALAPPRAKGELKGRRIRRS